LKYHSWNHGKNKIRPTLGTQYNTEYFLRPNLGTQLV